MNTGEPIIKNVPLKAASSPRRWGIWLLIPLLAGYCSLFVLAMKWRESLTIQRAVVEGAHALSAQQICSLAKVSLKSSMYETDLAALRQRIAAHPFIKSVVVCRRLPDAIVIDVTEREPIASLSVGGMICVDRERVALPVIQSSVKFDLPIIRNVSGLTQPKFGEVIANTELATAINILRTALEVDSSLYHFISEIDMNNGNDIILYSIDVGVPIMLGRGNVARKLITLQSFWTEFVKTHDSEKLKYVDLRYDDQVVVKWNQRADQPGAKASL